MIVDDSSFQRKMVSKIVVGDGHEVIQAVNGREGVKMAETHSPDCIIMDMLMPELNGIDALKLLRSEGSTIPVIILTSDIQESVRKQCLELEVHAFLNKPPKASKLKEEMSSALSLT